MKKYYIEPLTKVMLCAEEDIICTSDPELNVGELPGGEYEGNAKEFDFKADFGFGSEE